MLVFQHIDCLVHLAFYQVYFGKGSQTGNNLQNDSHFGKDRL